jgi:uncharacterized protein (TIGR03546 family)
MLRAVAKILKVINSETDPGQISLAVSFSLITGFTPIMSPHNLVVLLVVLLLRVNLSTFILGTVLFSGVAYVLDPLFSWVGLSILTAAPLEGLWTALYNTTFFRLARFNNSMVMGSLLLSLLLFVPTFFLSNLAIRRYREHVLEWVRKSRVMQAFTASKFYSMYQSVSGWGR